MRSLCRIMSRDYMTGSYYGIIWRDNITGLYYRIIVQDYMTEVYYAIVLQDHIMEIYHRIILRNYFTGSYYGIILQNGIMELDYGIIFTKRIPGMPGTHGHAPGHPQGRLRAPGHVPESPRGRPWDPRGLPGTPMDHKNGQSSTSIQRQKLSVAVFEPACWDPSPEGLPENVLFYKKSPQSRDILEECTAKARSMRRA